MGNLASFIEYLHTQVESHSIYVWGAQGQDYHTISEAWIKARETSSENAARAITYWTAQVKAGYAEALRAFDCSGLGMYFLQNLTGLCASDRSADGLLRDCASLTRADAAKGDWVFRTYAAGSKKGQAYHIGYIVDDALNVIEAHGRDAGVILSPIDHASGCWNAFGRPKYFAAEIAAAPTPPAPPPSAGFPTRFVVTRVLKIALPHQCGEDVKELQARLITLGYSVGTKGADGIFGNDTATAVESFQRNSHLEADGRAGKDTITALGGLFQEN